MICSAISVIRSSRRSGAARRRSCASSSRGRCCDDERRRGAGPMTVADLVLTRGTVVLPGEAAQADVLVSEGRILDVVGPGTGRGARVIDASERIVLPGGIDPHVHFLIGFMGQKSVYDFHSGTAAALRGGVTMVIDFALQRRGTSRLDG